MPTTEPISTPEISITHVVTVVFDPVKYDSYISSQGVTDAVPLQGDQATHVNELLSTTSGRQRETQDSVHRKRQTRSPSTDLTAVRIPTYQNYSVQI